MSIEITIAAKINDGIAITPIKIRILTDNFCSVDMGITSHLPNPFENQLGAFYPVILLKAALK